MISIYIHIPFCRNKCKYCSFLVVPQLDKNFIERYYNSLIEEIKWWSNTLNDKEVKTIYLGGGTPFFLGKNKIYDLIDFLFENFNLAYLEEINIELNPVPYNDIIGFIEEVGYKRKNFYRIRFSFGIQTFDDQVLKSSGREYTFLQLKLFLRDIQKIKKSNFLYNFDFIAFGTERKDYQYVFFEKFVKSYLADSFSIYMLELLPGSIWYNVKFDEDSIIKEYQYMIDVITKAGYKRYEISNFSLVGKQCLHNLVYWNLEDWIGIGIGAWSFLNTSKIKNKFNGSYVKIYNPPKWRYYFSGNYEKIYKEMNEYDYKYEEFMMLLRKNEFIDIENFIEILEKDYLKKLKFYEENGYIEISGKKIRLTNKGFLIYNHIFTDLVK